MKNFRCFLVYKINSMWKMLIKRIFFLLPVLILPGLVLPQNRSTDSILARVGSKEITVKDFLERSELTVRPQNFKDKYTALNNLISEKLLAIEAEKNKTLEGKKFFEGTLRGIKEQSMRDKLYNKMAVDKTKITPDELKNAYRASLREYEIEFFTLRNKELADDIESEIDSFAQSKDQIFKELETDINQKPIRKVSFKDKDDDAIHSALFANPLDTGEVVGPLKLTNGEFIIMKVLKWVDKPLMGGEDQVIQWNKVKEKLLEIKARKLFLAYQAQIMKGKIFEFDVNSFNAIADAAMDYYLSKTANDSLINPAKEIPTPKLDIDPAAGFFTVNNKSWTVGDFKNELPAHPLVFRIKKLDKNNFKRQFQLAVVDMMRDYFLTQEAYKDSLDKSDEVTRTVNMWKDSFTANAEMSNVIKSALDRGIINREDNLGMLKYKEDYIKNLQMKYGDSVEINFKLLDNLSITKVDFLAVRPGVPFPLATPNFPILIRSEKLDYAKNASLHRGN